MEKQEVLSEKTDHSNKLTRILFEILTTPIVFIVLALVCFAISDGGWQTILNFFK